MFEEVTPRVKQETILNGLGCTAHLGRNPQHIGDNTKKQFNFVLCQGLVHW